MFEIPPPDNPLERVNHIVGTVAVVVGGLVIVPTVTILGLATGLRLLADPEADAATTTAGRSS